jgi:hypothetical protein
VACTQKQPEKQAAVPPPPAPRYYFYPKANVYFDSANMDFVFLGNDGKTWQTVKQIPAAMQVMMDKNVLIDSPAAPVWKDNESHRLVYSALLYAAPSDTQAEKKVMVVLPPKENLEKKKERKGLRGFFDKIFKRKKKNDTQ